MKHIVNFSGGLCSFWAAWRVREKHGPEDMVLLFADTLIEDEDLYQFKEDGARILGVPITRVSREMEPWELFEKEGIIGNSRFPICSLRLKREPLNEWQEAHCLNIFEDKQETLFGTNKVPFTMYVGFDWTEERRTNDLRAEHPEWRIEAPMQERPIWDKCRM